MARIPDDEIDRLKQIPLQRLAEAAGIKLKRHGKDLIGLCKFHDDKQPSLVITPAKNLWNCLGACGTGGTPIEWVMRAHRVGFRHAIELLRDGDPSSLATTSPVAAVKRSSVRFLETPFDPTDTDGEVLAQVVAFYHEQLKQSPEALGYLECRGLGSSEAIEHFKLGFANRTLGYRLPDKNRKEGEELRGRLQRLGILRESGHEHFNGSLVVPVFDGDGQVVEIYGRKVTEGLRKGTPLHLYLPGPHHGVWNLAALEASKDVILCESLLDALTFWVNGYRNVTTSYGVNGFTAEHLAAFARHCTERVLIAYDRDDAGDRAAAVLAAQLRATGIDAYRVEFPRGMDANEYALKVTPAAKSLGVLIRTAVRLGTDGAAAAPVAAASAVEEPSPNQDHVDPPGVSEQDPGPQPAPGPSPTPSLLPPPLSSPIAAAVPPPTQDRVDPPGVSEQDPGPQPAPAPPSPPLIAEAKMNGDEVLFQIGSRRYRVRGLPKSLSYEQLKVNVHVAHLDAQGEPDLDRGYFVDVLNLYADRHRASFVKRAAAELGVAEGVLHRELGRVLYRLEQLQDARIRETLEGKPDAVAMTDAERLDALAFLEAPDLLERILVDFERCGIVGEETNKLIGYLATVSRKLEEPLAILIQSSSAAGKSSLMEAILALIPEEERVAYSAMTDQSLFYMGATELKHKVLAIAEEEGARRASYALKLLQSEGELTIASTSKNPETGRLETQEYNVEGPVMLLLTTTAIDIDEELMNRCLVLTVSEERCQTRAIHQLQRERQTLSGLLARRDSTAVRKLHQNAQRLLRPLLVANPFAEELTFLDDRIRTRRDHVKYLTLIRSIAFLHQYQRPVRQASSAAGAVDYIEVVPEDIAIANLLADEVLGRSLDELAPQTRRLLVALDGYVGDRSRKDAIERADVRFTRREAREATGLGMTQLHVHLDRLLELEYVVTHRGTRGQSYLYELVCHGRDLGESRLALGGLADAKQLGGHNYDAKLAGLKRKLAGADVELAGVNRAGIGPESGGVRVAETPLIQSPVNDLQPKSEPTTETAYIREKKTAPPSYPYAVVTPPPPEDDVD